jgi:hypothetical protein
MTIRIHGVIGSSDLKDFNAAVAALRRDKRKLHMNAVQLDSTGGELSTGMAIGKVVRNRGLATYVAVDAVCHSACVHVLIGGVQRYPFGEIGVHRTTFFQTPDPVADKYLPQVVAKDIKRIRAYVSLMGISSQFSEAIFSTPAWFVRVINDREKYEWQVMGANRVLEEQLINQMSRKFQIDRPKLLSTLEKNYDSCLDESKDFQRTIFECFEDRLNRSEMH